MRSNHRFAIGDDVDAHPLIGHNAISAVLRNMKPDDFGIHVLFGLLRTTRRSGKMRGIPRDQRDFVGFAKNQRMTSGFV